jgi:hypothetical protein
VADGWCWFVLREEYCWLVAGGWFVVREKYCWLAWLNSAASVHLQRATNWRRRLAAGILRIPNPVGFGKLLLHAIYAENLPSMDHGLVNTAGRKWLDDCLNSTGVKGPFRPPSPA